MVERRNFGQGTCPEPGCGKTVRLTAEGVIRQHGPRKDPCPGSGKQAKEDAGPETVAGPDQESGTVDNRPTAAESGEQAPGGMSAWTVYRTREQKHYRSRIGEPDGPGEGTVRWAEQVAMDPDHPAGDEIQRAVEILFAADLAKLAVVTRERLQEIRADRDPAAPRDFGLDQLLGRAVPNPHRAPLAISEMRTPPPLSEQETRERDAARIVLGLPNGPTDADLAAAGDVVLHAPTAMAWESHAVQTLVAAGLHRLSAGVRARIQEARQAAVKPPAPEGLEGLDKPDDGRTPEQQAIMDARRADPMGHSLQELQRATAPTPEQLVTHANPFDTAPPSQPAPVPTLSQPNPAPSTLNPGVPYRGPFDVATPVPAGNPLPFDAAPPAAPVSTVRGGKGVRPGPEDSDFNQWRQYKIPDPETGKVSGRQRVTTFAKTISDQYQLGLWQQRVLLQGAGLRPDLASLALGKSVSRNQPGGEKDVPFLDDLVERVKEAAGASEAAAHGTTVHKYTEHADMGLMTASEWETIPDVIKRDLVPYRAKLAEAGLVPIPEMVERTTIVRALDVCGTLDRIFRLPNGDHVIGDVKTGQKLDYAWLDIGIQLACYAHGVNENGVFDWGTRSWIPAPKVREDYAIVIHLPAGGQTCTLYRVDLAAGWAHAVLARSIRDARKTRNLATVLDLEAPEFQDAGEVMYRSQMGLPEPGPNPILSGPSVGVLQATQAAPERSDVADHEHQYEEMRNGDSRCYWCGDPEPGPNPWPTNLPPIPAPGTIPLAIDTPRPVLFTPEQEARINHAATAPLHLVTGGPTLPHLAEPAPVTDPMEQMRNMAREAMGRAVQQSDMARVYETALGVFPPGDPVFADLASIGERNRNIAY